MRVERDSGMSGRTPREKEGQPIQRVQPTAPKKVPAFTALVDFSSVPAAAIHDGRATFSSPSGRWVGSNSIHRNAVCVDQLEIMTMFRFSVLSVLTTSLRPSVTVP